MEIILSVQIEADAFYEIKFHIMAILRLILEGKMGHLVNLLPEAFGTILDCFMSLDFNNMILWRVWGGGR